ncbi:MAG: S1/P1 nuclease [Gemmatimonadales bacterium]
MPALLLPLITLAAWPPRPVPVRAPPVARIAAPVAAAGLDAGAEAEAEAGRTTLWWGVSGHRAIGAVAFQLMTPTAQAHARQLLGDTSFADGSVWADNLRPTLPETAPWHYVNTLIDGGPYDRNRDCPDGDCVIEAIDYFRRVLADRSAPKGARIEALKYLIHFVGDLHQPLHVGDAHDHGGNDVLVDFVDRGERRLHWVWDSGLFEAAGWTEASLTVAVAAEARDHRAEWQGGTVTDWAEEGRRLSRDRAYRLPASRKLDGAYVADNVPVAMTQLARAAVRLARMLDQVLGGAP